MLCDVEYYIIIGNGIDYNSGVYDVTFSAGVTSSQLNIAITDDNILEPDESFTITIDQSTLPNGVMVVDPSEATVTIVDDDGECDIIITMNG